MRQQQKIPPAFLKQYKIFKAEIAEIKKEQKKILKLFEETLKRQEIHKIRKHLVAQI